MKIGILKHSGTESLAAVYGPDFLEIPGALQTLGEKPVTELRELIMAYGDRILELDAQFQKLLKTHPQLTHPLAESEFLPPVPRCPKLFTSRGNSAVFTRVMKSKLPKQPTMEMRYRFNMTGHNATYVMPENYDSGGWNFELVAVFGKTASRVPQESAYDAIFGYTAMLDHSGRLKDYPFNNQWAIPEAEKTMLDYFYEGNYNGNAQVPLPVGPVIVTKDEIPDPHDLVLEERESGRLISVIHTSAVLFTIPEIVEYVSSFCTFEPGDMVSTASIGYDGYGNYPERMPDHAYYQVKIEPIGILRLNVVDHRAL